jgi:3-oxoacyl-[acyl-carrier-protein] synthase II
VDLPLVPILLDNYADSGLLAQDSRLDPFSPNTSGFIPGEGAAAIALSKQEKGIIGIRHFANNSDGADPVGIPRDGGRSAALLAHAVDCVGLPAAICPHATGTFAQAKAERIFLGNPSLGSEVSLHLLKPFFGHTIGASGLLESVVMIRFMQEASLPPNLPSSTSFSMRPTPESSTPCRGAVYKLAHGMGGHNALAVFHPQL